MIQGKKLAQPNTLLSEREEKRFEEFYVRFSRTGTVLTFSELLMFALDRSIIHNKIGFSVLHSFFEDASQFTSEKHQQQQQRDDRPVYPGMVVERGVTRPQFNFLLAQLSFYIYHSDKNHLDRLLSEILAEKTVVLKDSTIEVVRNLIYDELNKRILGEAVIRCVCLFEQELKNLFTIYLQENLDLNDIMLTWKEIAVQNKKLNAQALVRFLRDADIVPHILSIEQFEEVMMKMVPPANNREHEFYSKGFIVHLYEKEDPLLKRVDGDPHIAFHEFQLLLARIAFETCGKEDLKDQKKDPERVMKFFSQGLFLRQNDEIGFKALPGINRRMIANLERYTSQLMNPAYDEDEQFHAEQPEENYNDPMMMLAQQQHDTFFNGPIDKLNFPIDVIFRQLDKELPPVPPKPEHTREFDKWEPEGRKVIGEPLPAPPPDKNKKAGKPKQKARRKAGEPEPRKINFEDPVKPTPKTSEEYQMDLVDRLNFEQKLLSNVERGTMSDIQVLPVLIPEIIYPPQPPKSVRVHVEAAINAHNEGNFIFAIGSYEAARKEWISLEGRDIGDGLELYFEFQRASVFESAGRDDLALQAFLQARTFGNKLPGNSPDRALAFCGLGLVLYNTEEWELALRSFLKAREFREKLLGVESVDTATTFNNLGCCMYMLDRNQEAYAYFKLSHAVLEQHLGPFHTRTMTAARNIMKCNKNYFDNVPEYKKLWVTYVEDPFATSKKKKKKKGKK